MTIEEKLQKCVEFIKAIESGEAASDMFVSATDPRVDGDFQCEECGSRSITGTTCVGVPDSLKDKAWHLLADIA